MASIQNRTNKLVIYLLLSIIFLTSIVLIFLIEPKILTNDPVFTGDIETIDPEISHIGVLAKENITAIHEQWDATADYLSVQIPNHTFVIVPLSFNEFYAAIELQDIEFAIVNSAMYVDLEYYYLASEVATMKNNVLGNGVSEFGGGIIYS